MKKSIFLLGALALSFAASAQDKFSLSGAREYAMEHAYGMQIAELEIDRAKQIYRQNLAYGLPQVSATGQYAYNIELGGFVADMNGDGVLETLVFGTDYQAQGNLTVSQLVFDGSYVVGLMAAKVLKDGAALNAEKSKAELVRDVAKAYHMALLSEASVAVLEANVGYLESMKNEMQKMNAAGFVSKADADQVELNYNTVVNALNYAKGQSKVAKMLLKLQMGYPVEREVVLADELDQLVIGAANASTLTTLSFDPSQTIDYQVMANQIAGAELQLKNQYMQFLPSLGVSYQNNIQYMSPEANIFSDAAVDLPTSLVGGQISIPLFSSGNRLAKVAEAKIQRDQANIGLNQLEQALIMQHQNATNEYFRAIADYLAQKKNVELAKTIRNQRRREFEEGVGSSTELTQSETQYQQALQSLFLAAQTALDKQAELEYLMNKHTQN
ncbi:MAG: hypothetical protein RL754_789 [Bacteroidota bacterium]|jgi:outer membrane protein TolC